MVGGGAGAGRGRGGPTTVSILVKTGTSKIPLKGLESLHGKKAEIDIDLTWEDAFAKHFHVRIDKLRYSIRRGEPSAPKHFVAEPIRIWLGEFKKVRANYVVHVMENSVHRQVRKSQKPGGQVASPATASASVAVVPGVMGMTMTLPRSPQRPTAVNLTDKNKVSASASTVSGGRKVVSKSNSPKKRADKRHTGKVKFPNPRRVKREPSPAPSAASSSETAPLPPPSPHRQRSAAAAATGTSTSSPSNSRVRSQPPAQAHNSRNGNNVDARQRPSRFAEDNMANVMSDLSNGQQGGNGMMVDDDDYDVRSQCSQDSQDSQDDLVELGIPNEDFKSVFIKRAMDKFTNPQLLKARKALRDMKNAERNNRWMKFAMLCPLPVTVLRELFDV